MKISPCEPRPSRGPSRNRPAISGPSKPPMGHCVASKIVAEADCGADAGVDRSGHEAEMECELSEDFYRCLRELEREAERHARAERRIGMIVGEVAADAEVAGERNLAAGHEREEAEE